MLAEIPGRILLIQLQQLGDVLLTSPLLEDLRAAFPSARIDFLTRIAPASLLQGNPYPTEVILYDHARALRMPWLVRSRRYDCVIDAQSSPRSAQVVLASGAHRRVGWRSGGPWRLVYTDHIRRDEGHAGYVVRDRQRLLGPLNVPVADRRPRLYLDSAERAQGEAEVRARNLPAGTPRVGLVLSAGSPPSIWPVERFAALATRLAADGIAPIVLRTRGDEDAVSRCVSMALGALRMDAPELRRFLGLLSALDVLVCADTGPAHMAMALDVATVTLYGPTPANHWNPGLPTTAAVSSPRASCPACAAGLRRHAPSHRCMLEIEVDAVYARVRAMLSSAPARPRT